jgi:hypothetical protein
VLRRVLFRRLLKYWSGSRCCGFWHWPRRETQRRYPQRSRPSEQRRPAPKSTQPLRARGRRAAGPERFRGWLRRSFVPAPCGDAPHSLLANPPFCLYARPTPVFQQSLRLGGSGAPSHDAKWRRRHINFQHRAHDGGLAVERSIHLDEKVPASFGGRMRSQVILGFMAGASLPTPGPSELASQEEKPRELAD